MAVTLAEVARRAGVSLSAASRVLNNKMSRPYSPDTVDRILQAAGELNYVPNRLARGLALRRTHTIGFYTPSMTDPHIAVLLDMIEITARERGYQLLVSSNRNSLANAAQTDGLLVLGLPDEEARPECPFVCVHPAREVLSNVVGWSDFEGSREVAHYLASLGHKKIAGIYAAHQREKGPGLRAGAHEAGMEVVDYEEQPGAISPPNWAASVEQERQRGYLLAQRMLQEHPDVTAIFARNDMIAIGAMQALREAAIPVPERMSVVGYLNIKTAATSVVPTLTSVCTPIAEAGRIATHHLLDAIEGDDEGEFPGRHLPTSLVIRESTGPAPPSEIP